MNSPTPATRSVYWILATGCFFPSTYDLTVLVAAATRDGFEYFKLAPFERARLRGQQQQVERGRKACERGEYNILGGEALREVGRGDCRAGRDEQKQEEREEEEARDA